MTRLEAVAFIEELLGKEGSRVLAIEMLDVLEDMEYAHWGGPGKGYSIETVPETDWLQALERAEERMKDNG